MKFSRIAFAMLLPFCLISCQNGIGEKRDVKEPKQNEVPATEYQKTEKRFPKSNKRKPAEKPLDNEVKKQKAIDTLKPAVAIP